MFLALFGNFLFVLHIASGFYSVFVSFCFALITVMHTSMFVTDQNSNLLDGQSAPAMTLNSFFDLQLQFFCLLQYGPHKMDFFFVI